MYGVTFSPDGAYIASPGSDGSVTSWEAATGSLVGTFQLLPHDNWMITLPDGRYTTSRGADRYLEVVDRYEFLPLADHKRARQLPDGFDLEESLMRLSSYSSESDSTIPVSPSSVGLSPSGTDDLPDAPLDPIALVRAIQTELDRHGCQPGNPDGVWGGKSSGAVERFNRHAEERLASTSPTRAMLSALRSLDGRVCLLECGTQFEIREERCVRRTDGSAIALNGSPDTGDVQPTLSSEPKDKGSIVGLFRKSQELNRGALKSFAGVYDLAKNCDPQDFIPDNFLAGFSLGSYQIVWFEDEAIRFARFGAPTNLAKRDLVKTKFVTAQVVSRLRDF